ncbi:MAG: SHOCT domain-containing protein [Kiloniellaceae bacterium]
MIALPLVLTAVPALSQTSAEQRGYWHDSWDMGWGFGHMAFGGLMMLLFWGAVIAVVVIAVQRLGGGSPGTRTQPSDKRALDILQQRFARGEIEKEEFEERRRLLSD